MSDYYSVRTATALIIANMIGTGVFTSLGFQLIGLESGFALLMLWVLGGITALCGAASYAELGAALPYSGGEYNFLGRIYHPAAGFISGWVSATIGFAAPTAAIAIAFSHYSTAALPGTYSIWAQKLMACCLVILLAFVHGQTRTGSSRLQNIFTALKISLILGFCFAAFYLSPTPQPIHLIPNADDITALISAPFAISLIYVSYAYTGWNAATYIIGELKNPQKDLPFILLIGTALVMGLYILLNYAFLYAAPMTAMRGKVEIGYIAAQYIFGDTGARLAGGMLAILLISSASAMTIAGPRALHAIGQNYPALNFLGRFNSAGIPRTAIYFQSTFTLIFIVSASFQSLIIFSGAMLAFNSFLSVFGLFVLRWRQPELPRPYKTWLYPVTPLIYLGLTGFILLYVVKEQPIQALFGVGVIATGFLFYLATQIRPQKNGP